MTTFSFPAGSWTAGNLTGTYTAGAGAGAVNITFTVTGTTANLVGGSPSLQQRGNMNNSLSIDMDQVSAGQAIDITMAFSKPVNKLRFITGDVDGDPNGGGQQWEDRLVYTGLNGATAANPTLVGNGAIHTVAGNMVTATSLTGCGTADATCNVTANFANPVNQVGASFIAGPDIATPTQQYIGFNQFGFCVPNVDLSMVKDDGGASFTAGSTGTYTFTVTNNGGAATTATTTMKDILPAGMSFVSPLTPGGANGALWACVVSTTTNTNDTATCTRATGLAAGASNTFTLPVSVALSASGTLTNRAKVFGGGDVNKAAETTTGTIASCTTDGVSGGGANSGAGCGIESTPIIAANAPTVTKAFAPTSIGVGGTSVLTITLTNNNAGVATLAANLVDTLPAGVTLANATFGGTCTGTKSGVAGGNTVTYASGGTIPAGAPGSCTITANVTSSTPGTVTNTIAAGALQTNFGNNATAATANLTVAANAPTVAKAFAPASIAVGGTSVLTITLTNNNATAATLSAALVDTLPAGVTLANATFGGTCTGTKSGVAGGATVTYASGATIPGGAPGSCTITANVTSSTVGTVTNTIAAGALQTSNGNNAAAATANLTVTANAPSVAKAFAPATIVSGGTSVLTITLSNNNAVAATLSAALVDTLPSGVTLANATFGGTCAGAKSGVAGGTTVTYASGSTIPSGAPGTCTITANVTSSTPGTVTNTIAAGALQTSVGNNAAAATANLTVNSPPALTVTKSATPAVLVVGATGQVYTITINVANGPTTAAINVSDVLPAGVTTNGAITATGGTLSGCPGSGATSLAACTVASGTNGPVVITVPVAVAANAANPTVNTATVTGGGDPNCTGTNCSGTTTNPVIDAVNDASTGQPGQAGTFNVSTNDKFPVGSTFTQTATTCVPAGTMTGAVANFTYPGTTGASCTVTYRVCAPAPNTTICDTAVLTVTAGAAPALTVTKSATPAVLVVGGTGQVYTITISVANGPTTAAINVSDVLPAGVSTNGAITATGGSLSGCPASGATSLAGCTVASGTNGPVVITVPVAVAANAANPTVNTATVTGGGDPTCTNCSGTTTNPVIDAVNDASTGQPGQAGTFNVSTNDKFPVGSTFTQTATTCVPAGTMTGAVANFTYPGTTGASCTVTYRVCAPAPNTTICDTAVLTVTAGAAPALTVTKSATPAVLVVGGTGQVYTITISVANGPTTAAINVSDVLPAGVSTNGAITATGGSLSGCPASGATSLAGCTVASGTNGPVVITVPVAVAANAANPTVNTATVTGGGDPTCTNCSGTTTNPVIDAVNDASTGQPGQAGTFNVSTNDKFPVGSTFTQTATTCVPAGTMTGAVANFTYPGTTGASCTVTYRVCAPAPNTTICDTAVLTVTAGAAPALTVTKSATPAVLVVGGTGQVYTITISVANGPTTAAINVSDVLPAGVSTNGAITATGGSLSGCPASGATSLAGCTVASGTNGPVVITVPVAVAANAANPTVNTATVTGGGDPTCTNCSGTTTNPVIDAVNDASTGQPGQAGTFNVSTNDKFPVGSTFTQTATTCVPAGTMTGAVANFTYPGTTGASCTVTYRVCAPAPNTTICDTAVLTVTAGAAPALTVTKSATPAVLVVGGTGQVYTITISVANGPTTAAINVSDVLPAGVSTNGAITATGGSLSGCPASGATSLAGCTVASGTNGPVVITVPVAVAANAANPTVNTATVTGGGDPTCTNCSGTTTNPVIDAVNDASTGQPGQAGTFNVSTNDKFPVGSTFTQTATTCVPAGTMTGAVANFTYPGTTGASCTVTYSVCAPAPNTTICDTAVLTVTAGAAPALTVTKSATPAVLVVGGTGQVYTITISVANGPTTAAINVSDVLPAGVSTNGAITATGGSLSGCPASGATSLAGCTVASGTNGPVVITVPVAVAANAANPTVNTATVTGGGDPTCTNCSGTTTNPVIDAVNDASTGQPGQAGTFNVSTNDKFPVGSTFTQTATTCVPAGTMTGAVANFTYPGTTGASCTVTYRVCAPAPNTTICDTAVLTVTAGAAPALTVTKSATPAVLVVGGTGQVYTITISVANGPTTAAINVSDVLPAGVSTNGAITATGGSLSGCPASGATSLAGCTVASGTNGPVVITVPVAVAANAANPTVNTATVTGGGDPTCTNCSGTTTNPVIDAVNDASTGQPGQAGTFNVSTNDKFPVGSTFTQTATTCVPAGTMTGAVANFTYPGTTGASCTVTYSVCAPAPNTTICDTAVLTVTAGAAPALTVTKSATPAVLVVGGTGQVYTITISVANGPTTAAINVSDVLPAGVSTNGAITATGGSLSGCPASGATSLAGCTVASGTNGPVVITVPVAVAANAANPTVNTATVTGGGDPTCTNCSGTTTNPVIDAVNDASTGQPGQAGTFNVSTNDKFPVGSTFTQTATTCVPAGTMTGAVANFTYPGTTGASCTVTYSVCAPAPNTTICDTAVLTVTAGAAPALTVTKSATPAVLVVGGTGQVYTITISVANGPTTAAINVSDVLPAGVSTNGAITATGGSLSGCPASGATSLAGCTVASGTNGPVVITVPVAVAANAANPTVNTATVTGGGDPTCTNCSGTTTNPVIDAVNDASTGQPGQAGTFNVSTNDKFPVGSTFTQTATTCVPAGTMTGAVANFTYPGTTGASCTVTYRVCAPAPNTTICDTAVLTVTAGAAPALTVTKSATPAVLVVGGTGQVYTITISVANGPTTAAINVSDVLPAGVSTNGAITATGGSLSGCPASGATSLAGCTVASGTNGPVVITVPVAVAANAANPTVNTATVTGGGDPTCTNCSGTTTNPVIDAVNDASTGQPGQAGTFNVSTNDKFPVGSTFTQTATTCVPAGTMTGAVANFTYPGTTGASCTVTYRVCAPAPNTTICDTAVLTVTAGAAPALTVTKSATPAVLVVGGTGQVYTITISVANGPTTAAINVSDVLPAGVSTNGAITATGGSLSGCPASGATSLAGCTVASGTNGPVVITVPVAVAANAANPTVNTATVTGGGDPTCTNCSGTTTNPVIDAVNDASTGQPGQAGTFNVSTNDKFPVGSTFTQTATTCVPAGTMTGAVANFTYPGTTGASCTVTYSVCAPAPNTTICDTAVLTVTAGAAPALTVTKSATPAVLVVGGTGQVYTITISVANGPTTAAINVSDVLPAGVSTNGAITATGGSLSGCPASGATSLAGCTVASGTNGPVVITVPVAVAANAANPTVNTATVTGGGDPTCTNCSGTTTNPVIDAVNDASTGQPGQAGTFNVSTNDKFPVGSTFTQTATTCVPAGTMTGAVANFTYPGTTGASCTVTYSVCAPAPNTTICDTAVLTVTAGAAPDLTPTFTFGSTSYTVGQTREVIININEINGVTTAGPVTFFVPQPQGVAFDDYVFNPTQTNATTLSGSPAVDNVNWTAFDNGVGLVFTLKDATPGVPLTVPANGRRRIVIQTTARDPGGKGAITVNIQANSGGELRTNNNVVVLLTSVQR
ncbi:beta strand repeat-containing protein [Casimicrobium huifangae]|uniref:beta strand repeat-containing protein n=1 Tax=Casimicrobium huifangae TaxID=2591109 RepID=UPI0013969756|nr:DUF11 domain-containing protein [Casimicrobium huifangae]